jgi:hypothetical protein
MVRNHVEDPNNRDAWSENEFEELEICARLSGANHNGKTYETCEEPIVLPSPNVNSSQDLAVFSFTHDDINDIIFPKGKDYREQLMKYEDKDPGSIMILNQGNEGALYLCEDDQKSIALIKSHPPPLFQLRNTQDGKGMVDLKARTEYFQRGRLVLMWDKRKRKAKYAKGVW